MTPEVGDMLWYFEDHNNLKESEIIPSMVLEVQGNGLLVLQLFAPELHEHSYRRNVRHWTAKEWPPLARTEQGCWMERDIALLKRKPVPDSPPKAKAVAV